MFSDFNMLFLFREFNALIGYLRGQVELGDDSICLKLIPQTVPIWVRIEHFCQSN